MTLTGLGPRSHPLEQRAQLICSTIAQYRNSIGKVRTLHYVITVATDEYHIAKSEPELRISHEDYDNTLRHEYQIVSDAEESTVSGLVEDLPSLLATKILSLCQLVSLYASTTSLLAIRVLGFSCLGIGGLTTKI